MSFLLYFPLKSADAISPSVVILIFLYFFGQLAVLNCETADLSVRNQTISAKSIDLENITSISGYHENKIQTFLSSPPQSKTLKNINIKSHFSEKRNENVFTSPPQNNEITNINSRRDSDEGINQTTLTAIHRNNKLERIALRSGFAGDRNQRNLKALLYLRSLGNIAMTNGFDGNRTKTILTAPPQRKQLRKITMRSGSKDDDEIKEKKAREAMVEKQLKKHWTLLDRLEKDLTSRKNPGQISESFIEISELEELIKAQKKEEIPKRLENIIKKQEKKVAALRKKAKTKLLVPLNKDINMLEKYLEQFRISGGVTKKVRKKVFVLQYKLRELQDKLQTLETVGDLNRIKQDVEKVLVDMQELKSDKKDEEFVNTVEKKVKWVSSGMSHYIVRYSVWLVPN